MGLYLNGTKVKINVNNIQQGLKFLSIIPITNGIRLLDSNGYILKDSKNLYLTFKEDEK